MFVYYDESILTLVSSVRSHYGLDTFFNTDKQLDDVLKKRQPTKIITILIDGMGANLIKRKLAPNAFLNQHTFKTVQTVFPSATSAATTAILNGKAANQNAFMGWSQYFEDVNDEVILFYHQGMYSGKDYGADFIAKHFCQTTIIDELQSKGIDAQTVYPSFMPNGCSDFESFCAKISELKACDFIYAYWDKYDSLMHKEGPDSEIADQYLLMMNQKLQALAESLDENTLLMIMADHGQVTIDKVYNLYGSKYEKYFRHLPSLEPRSQVFFIKDGMHEQFAKEFKLEFENDFILLNHEQVVASKLFGSLENHPDFEKYIGDFIAIAKSHMMFVYDPNNQKKFLGNHGGIMDDEVLVPFIVY